MDLDLKRYMDENKDTFNRNHRLIKVKHLMACTTEVLVRNCMHLLLPGQVSIMQLGRCLHAAVQLT